MQSGPAAIGPHRSMLYISSVPDVIANRGFVLIWERRIEPWSTTVECSAA
jgi:hypothetical protein